MGISAASSKSDPDEWFDRSFPLSSAAWVFEPDRRTTPVTPEDFIPREIRDLTLFSTTPISNHNVLFTLPPRARKMRTDHYHQHHHMYVSDLVKNNIYIFILILLLLLLPWGPRFYLPAAHSFAQLNSSLKLPCQCHADTHHNRSSAFSVNVGQRKNAQISPSPPFIRAILCPIAQKRKRKQRIVTLHRQHSSTFTISFEIYHSTTIDSAGRYLGLL